MISSTGRVWASSDSIAAPMPSSSLCAGTSATIRGRLRSGRGGGRRSGMVSASAKRTQAGDVISSGNS